MLAEWVWLWGVGGHRPLISLLRSAGTSGTGGAVRLAALAAVLTVAAAMVGALAAADDISNVAAIRRHIFHA